MIFATVVFLGVAMFACVVGAAIIPRFDRRVALGVPQGELANGRRVSTSRRA